MQLPKLAGGAPDLSGALPQTILKNIAIRGTSALIAEWNMNRYAVISSVTNTVEDYDEVLFPIESIVKPDRPNRGLLKARVTTRTTGVTPEAYTTSGYTDLTTSKRSYTASEDSEFKYWTSPAQSSATISGGKYAISNVSPTVTYATTPWVNKLVLCFENTVSSPVDFTIQTSVNGSTWVTASTSPTINSKGRVEIWRQANGSWSTTPYYEAPIQLKAIRLNVTTMTGKSTFFNLIELSARLESDLSGFVVSYDSAQSMSEHSFVTPLGQCSSNTSSVVLSNIDGRFNNDNPASLYYNIIDKNILFKGDLIVDTSEAVAAGAPAGNETTRQFTMLSDSWNGTGEDVITVNLVDSSVFLQGVSPASCLYQQQTVGEIVWRLCDAVGFNNYVYETKDDDPATLVPYFWTNGELMVWDYFQQLAQSTQTAIYFDEFNVLQIQTRSSAYNKNKTDGTPNREPDWTFDYSKVTSADVTAQSRPATEVGKLADIEEINQGDNFEANKVEISYSPTSISGYNNGFPALEVVWEPPEENVVLRATRIRESMTSSQTSMYISIADIAAWPYSGVVQIEGEFIRFTTKSYLYYKANGFLAYKAIDSQDAKVALDRLNPSRNYKNHFTGTVSGLTRGIWGTTPAAHNVDITGWNSNRYRTYPGAVNTWNGGRIHNKTPGTLTLKTNSTFTSQSWYVATHGATTDSTPYWFGTRLRFQGSGYTDGIAGMGIELGTNDSGYFVEVNRTKIMGTRKYINELCFYVRRVDGSISRIGPDAGKGVALGISAAVWYDLDIHLSPWSPGNTTRNIQVMVNGINRMSVTFSTTTFGDMGQNNGGKFCLFTRGFTAVDFEYVYTSTNPINDSFDEEGYFDKIQGGYQSGQWDREWVYGLRYITKIRNNKKSKMLSRYNSRFFDEFGPIAHEVREYEVKFSKFPVLHSKLYLSNDYQVICPEYTHTPFGAKFVIANTSRVNAIVKGEDTKTFGVENPVNQTMAIYGRMINVLEDKKYTVQNDAAIARRGVVDVSIEGKWIQTETAAKALGTWITSHWANGNDEVELNVFGNPLIQIGDLVAINYSPVLFARSTHRYFVVEIKKSFDGGLSTLLTLRRCKLT